jgi:RNA polymerase primary sigma factor
MPNSKPKHNDDEQSVDVEEQKQQLVEQAKKDGHISQRDIFAVLPDTPENAEILDALYTELADSNIEVTATEPNAEDFTDEWAEDESEDDTPTDTRIYLDDDISDDSVRLYLREIGKIPLLSAEEELALAHRVVAGDQDAKDKMAEANMRLVV